MAVHGSLQELELLSLLQMVCEAGEDAWITVQRGSERATLYLQGGQVVHAEGADTVGEEVLYEILTWTEGTFALTRSGPAPRTSIQRDWTTLLLEGLRRLDEHQHASATPQTRTVLAVSDSEAFLTRLSTILDAYATAWTPLTTTSPTEAMALLRQLAPDILLIAWHGTPVEAAPLFCHLIEHRMRVPTVLIVQTESATIPATTQLNPALFLPEPLTDHGLIATLEHALARGVAGEALGLSLYTLCEWIRVAEHTCLIRILAPQGEGLMAFIEGRLLNAVTGQQTGEAAVKAILDWHPVTMELANVAAKVKSVIHRPFSDIVLEHRPTAVAQGTGIAESSLAAPEPQGASTLPTVRLLATPGAQNRRSTPQDTQKEQPQPLQDTDIPGQMPTPSVLDPSGIPRSEISDSALILAAGSEAMPAPGDSIPVTGARQSFIYDKGGVTTPLSPSIGVVEMAQATDSKIEKTLAEIMTINGAMGVALVDLTSGMALGKAGSTGLDMDVAAAGNSEVVKSKLKVMRDLGIRGDIEDILITLQSQYHLIRPLGSDSTLFLYVILNKDTANLALARRQLSKSEAGLVM